MKDYEYKMVKAYIRRSKRLAKKHSKLLGEIDKLKIEYDNFINDFKPLIELDEEEKDITGTIDLLDDVRDTFGLEL